MLVLLVLMSILPLSFCECQVNVEATPCGDDICYHGHCESTETVFPGLGLRFNTTKCICDDTWFDARCNVCCDIQCPPMFKCHAELNVRAWTYDKVCIPDPDSNTTLSDYTTDTEQGDETYNPNSTGNLDSNDTQILEDPENGITPDYNSPHVSTCRSVPRSTTSFCNKATCHNGQCESDNKSMPLWGWISTSQSCRCDVGWIGHRCDVCCDLPCRHGNCVVEEPHKTMTCYCQNRYTGPLCEDLIPTTTPRTLNVTVIQTEERAPGWYWIVIGCSIAIVIVSVIVFSIMMYILWTRRNIYILQIVRIFQAPEDENDGKVYDAFVSASSSEKDTDFCIHQLRPKVETEMGYKLFIPCIHEVSGPETGNYKASLVEASRRTILLLSPEYLQEEWSRFEYVVAQNEMLKLRHKIVPIILSDIDSKTDMDPALKNMIKSIGSIVWPGDDDERKLRKFWKRVELSLPKKQKTSEQSVKKEPSKQMLAFKNLFTKTRHKNEAQESKKQEMAV